MPDPVAESIDRYFAAGYRCAESVLLHVAKTHNIQSDWIPKIATGFCAGISRMGGTCGAVSGAVMAISLFCGRNDPSVPLTDSYPPIQAFIQRFEETFGSMNCVQLIHCDLATEDGRKKFIDENIIVTCQGYTTEAARMALSVIDDMTGAKTS
mgnify:CR=1 FL=1